MYLVLVINLHLEVWLLAQVVTLLGIPSIQNKPMRGSILRLQQICLVLLKHV